MASKRRRIKKERARQKKSRRNKRIAVLIIELIILAILAAAAYVVLKYNKLQKVDLDSDNITINEGIGSREGYTTVALFGGDSREGQLEAGTHADTIILVSLNNKTGEIKMASVYRDTLLEQMDNTLAKANHAYFNGGPEEAISMLNKNLDLNIDDYVTVDFSALVDSVDLLGGLEIEVTAEEAEAMNKYIGETASVSGKTANYLDGAGTYTMDGVQATTYARIRKLEGGDYKRTERQRIVLEKMFEKAMDTNVLTINKIIDQVFEKVSTSFGLQELLGYATQMTKFKLGDTTGFPFELDDSMTYGSQGSVVVPVGLKENVEELHRFLYPEDETWTASETLQRISDEITNNTGVVRPAEEAADAETGEDMSQQGTAE